jgi:hypothetical protein
MVYMTLLVSPTSSPHLSFFTEVHLLLEPTQHRPPCCSSYMARHTLQGLRTSLVTFPLISEGCLPQLLQTSVKILWVRLCSPTYIYFIQCSILVACCSRFTFMYTHKYICIYGLCKLFLLIKEWVLESMQPNHRFLTIYFKNDLILNFWLGQKY